MPDSSSEDQLDAGVLSGEQPSCSAALTTFVKCTGVRFRGLSTGEAHCRASRRLALLAIAPLYGTLSIYRKEVKVYVCGRVCVWKEGS